MHEVIRKHRISFEHAFAGLVWAFRTQPNFRVHMALSIVALGLCTFFSVSSTEWAVIVLVIVFGLGAELINTSLEAMTDLITTEWRRDAKTAKDVAAGMMLAIALGAVIVAGIVFGPRIAALI